MRRVTINSLIMGGQQIAINLFSIVIIAIIARKLGKADYGIFSIAFTFTTFFAFLGHLGLRTITIREVAQFREQAYPFLGKIIPARILLILLMTCTINLMSVAAGYEPRVIHIIAIASLASLFEQMSRILSDIFQAFEEVGSIAVRDIFVRLLTGGGAALSLYYGYGLIVVSWVYVAGSFFGLMLNLLLYTKRFQRPIFDWDVRFIKQKITEGIPYMLVGIASILYTRIDIFMLSKMVNYDLVGLYGASTNLFYRLNIIADVVATASFPAIAKIFWESKTGAAAILNKSMMGVLAIGVPMSVGGVILADQIISFIYGSSYADSSPVLAILASSIPFMFLSLQLNYALGAIKLQKLVMNIIVFLLVLNVGLNLLLIPMYSIKGAALATLLTELVGCVFFLRMGWVHFKASVAARLLFSIVLASVCMGVLVFLIQKHNVMLVIAMGIMVYLFCLMVVGGRQVIRFIRG
jgi:O-antigen/teichoic acid export membrane protein